MFFVSKPAAIFCAPWGLKPFQEPLPHTYTNKLINKLNSFNNILLVFDTETNNLIS